MHYIYQNQTHSLILFILGFVDSILRMENISNFSNVNDYLPLLNAVLLTDICVILLMLNGWINSKVLRKWYEKYNLSAVIADVFIILLGLIIARFLYPFLFTSWSIVSFTILAVTVQICHDFLFFGFFSMIPRGVNGMLDTFKDYGKESGLRAILADSGMMISASILASLFKGMGLNKNIILLIGLTYLVPYLIYA